MSLNNKPDRERISGILRYAARMINWEIRIIDSSSAAFLSDCRRNLSDNRPVDTLIYSDHAVFAKAYRCIQHAHIITRVEIDTADTTNPPNVSVRQDNHAIVNAAIDLLTRRGYATLAHFGTNKSDERYYSELQAKSFSSIAANRNLKPHFFNFNQQLNTSAALALAATWIKAIQKPCGVLAYSDDTARSLLDACRLARVSVPEQVAIIGVDNETEICENSHPSLSSILPDFEAAGFLAAEALASLIRKRKPAKCQTIVYGIKSIHERNSTQDLRGCGRITTTAQALIQAQALTPITVSEIARKLNMSVRLLELDYLKITGRTVKGDLQNLRLRALYDQLPVSSIPISELVLKCGFKKLNTAQVAFRKKYGITMSIRQGQR